MVATGKAKAKIRSVMKEERRRKGEIGKEALERKLRNLKVDFEESVETLTKYYSLGSKIDLYYMLAIEDKTIPEIFRKFKVEHSKLVEIETEIHKPITESTEVQQEQLRKPGVKARLMINGEPAERFEFTFATCCNPVQGDDIFAYLTASAGLKIHRSKCPNALHLMAQYGYRVMKADWVITNDVSFLAELKIIGIDEGVGVIERLTHQLSTQLGLNIRKFSIEGDEGYFEGTVKLMVKNTEQLERAIQELQNLENISTVTRVS